MGLDRRVLRLATSALAVAGMVLGGGAGAVAGDEAAQRQAEVAEKLSKIPDRLTTFDYVEFGVSGPVVNLRGFALQPSIKPDAERLVRELDWVVHVINQIEYLPQDPVVDGVRKEAVAILRKALPQSFPDKFAHIRIRIDDSFDVRLVGQIFPKDSKRLAAAVVEIGQIRLVRNVDNQVTADRAPER